jgi:excisionase family DNA binding protein
MTMTTERQAFSPAEVAVMTGLCLCTVRKLIRQGRLGSIKIERRVLVSRDHLAAFLRDAEKKEE